MPIDAADLLALLPDLDDAPGPELTGAGSADGLRFTGLALTGDATGARLLECVLTDCDVSGVAFDRARLTSCLLTDLRSPTLTGCTIGELDVSSADLRDVRLVDCTVSSLVLAGARHRSVDLRGAAVERLNGVAGLRGCTISTAQLVGWAAGLAAELGIRVG